MCQCLTDCIQLSVGGWCAAGLESPMCINFLCGGLCLAASVASCVNPLGYAAHFATCKVVNLSAFITGTASATCSCIGAAKLCDGKGCCEGYEDPTRAYERINDGPEEVITVQP